MHRFVATVRDQVHTMGHYGRKGGSMKEQQTVTAGALTPSYISLFLFVLLL